MNSQYVIALFVMTKISDAVALFVIVLILMEMFPPTRTTKHDTQRYNHDNGEPYHLLLGDYNTGGEPCPSQGRHEHADPSQG